MAIAYILNPPDGYSGTPLPELGQIQCVNNSKKFSLL